MTLIHLKGGVVVTTLNDSDSNSNKIVIVKSISRRISEDYAMMMS